MAPWAHEGGWKTYPYTNTAFALLFLSKGHAGLISKMVPRRWPPDEHDTDWNNDRNDLRHSRNISKSHLFGKKAIAWQTYDISRALESRLDKNPVS